MSKNNPSQPGAAPGGTEESTKKFRRVRAHLIGLCAVLLAAIVLLAIRYAWIHPPKTVLNPDYPSVPEEPNRKPTGDTLTPMESESGGGAVALNYSDKVTYSLSTRLVQLQFANPGSSNHAFIIQLIVYGNTNDMGVTDEYLLAESGVLKPGFLVEQLAGSLDDNLILSQGVYKGVMRLLFYNPDTGEKSIVNTEIPVDITVVS